MSPSTCKKRKASDMMMVASDDSSPSLHGLGDFLTSSLMVQQILAFCDFDSLLLLRLVHVGLGRMVVETELFNRAIRVLPACTDVRNKDFLNTFCIRQGWKAKHMQRSSIVQAALDDANTYGQESSSRIVYEEGNAMKQLQAGQAVSMYDFRSLQEEDDEDDDDDGYIDWKVLAPKFNSKIMASKAWNLFQKHHFFPVSPYPESLKFSHILFGLLINARTVRCNRFKSTWERHGMQGHKVKCHLLIQLNNDQNIEIEMAQEMNC